MKVSAALDIGRRFNAEIIAGQKGLTREINFVEVMEVPEVEKWATEGILVITSLYSVKDDLDQQYHIVKSLIDKKAAGLIVKLGRFVDSLPRKVVDLADKSGFPIITIPKDVAYIDLLTPIYLRLHDEANRTVKEEQDLFYKFKMGSFESTDEAIECLAEVVNNTIYIEDHQGRLLYCSHKFNRDEWRNSLLLFSDPSSKNYEEKLKEWSEKLQSNVNNCIHVPGKRNRFLIPLKIKEKIIAFIHLIYNRKEQFHSIGMNIDMIKNKIYDTMVSDFIEFHRQRMTQSEQFESLIKHKIHTPNILLHFKRDLNQVFLSKNDSFLEHYFLFRNKLNELILAIPGVSQTVIFENQLHSYALLCFSENHPIEKAEIKGAIDSFLSQSSIADTFVAISPVFYDLKEIDEQINAVTKIMRIGEKVSPGQGIYSYDRLGVYEFLIKLSGEPLVQQYINEIIDSLYHHSDQSLLETLIVYLQENRNASRAAEKLFIHRRTMTNRLQRIKELLSMDLDDPENIFILQFCLKIRELN